MNSTEVHTLPLDLSPRLQELRERWVALNEEEPKLRIRNAAERLKASEMELLATGAFNEVIPLREEFQEILKELTSLGEVMALTRNDQAVHEVHGVYDNISFEGQIGLVHTKTIDLRLFLFGWSYVYAVAAPFRDGLRRSLQFFNAQGEAVHKVYLTKKSNEEAYHRLVEKYRRLTPKVIDLKEYTPSEETPDKEIDVEGFQASWRALEDTHDFFPMLREYGVTRTQALRLAPPEMVEQYSPESAVALLELMSAREIPIMIFAGNRGCLQIYTGPIKKLVRTGDWFNVLDPGFNLHLRDGEIHAAYLVRKPTVDGIVTALELYNEANENIALLFGERKPGIAEDPRWRDCLTEVVGQRSEVGL